MSFQEAVVFFGAVLAIVGAGVILGSSLRGRSYQRRPIMVQIQMQKVNLYSDLIGMLDHVSTASDMQKQRFIHKYYEALVYVPDTVVQAINRYLDAATTTASGLSADRVMELRGEVVKAMRQDILAQSGSRTKLAPKEFYKVEVRPEEKARQDS